MNIPEPTSPINASKKHPAKFSVAGGGHPARPNIMWIGPVELVE